MAKPSEQLRSACELAEPLSCACARSDRGGSHSLFGDALCNPLAATLTEKRNKKMHARDFEKREESLTEVEERTMVTTVTRFWNRRKDGPRIQRRPKLLVLASRGLCFEGDEIQSWVQIDRLQ